MNLADSTIQRPVITKVADLKLPKEMSKWEDEILDKFYEDVPYLPKDYGVELNIGNSDNKGYAEGAIVVWNKEKTINFPVIVRDYILSPFDIFRIKDEGEGEYKPADEYKVLEELSNNTLGVASRYYPYRTDVEDLKTPGGIPPKRSTYVDTGSTEFIKRSSHLDEKDLEKVASQLSDKSVKLAFMENSGDVAKTLYKEYDRISRKKKEPMNSIIDLAGSIARKEMNTIVEDNSMNPENYQPLEPGSGKIVTLRSKILPSVDDFLKNDPKSLAILKYTKVGAPIHGVLLNCYDLDNSYKCGCENSKRDIFISLDGSEYSCKYSTRRVNYYGKPIDKPLVHGLKLISENTTDDFMNVTMDNRDDGSDFYHYPTKEFNGGKRDNLTNRSVRSINTCDINLITICKNRDGDFAAFKSDGPFKVHIVNGVKTYTNNELCIVPTKGIKCLAQVGKINGLTDDLAVPDNLKIYVVPWDAIFINTTRMKRRSDDDFITPNWDIRSAITRIKTASISVDNRGYEIKSECFEPLKSVLRIDSDYRFDNNEAIECLNVMGVKKEAAKQALKSVISKVASGDNDPVMLFGVNDNYINGKPLEKIAKQDQMNEMIEQYITENLKFDTVKIASLLDDPESIENVLNINFITKENLHDFIDSIEEFESVREKLSTMLQASRMGLKDIDEEATKKAIQTLGTCVENLRALKGAIGK